MLSATRRTPLTLFVPPERLYRFTVEQFQGMIDSGVFTASERVELLEGWLVKKMTPNPPHCVALDCTQEVLRALLPAGWSVREQKPIETADSRPEPDLTVVRGEARQYRQRHPGPADIALVIEVADSTLDEDRGTKARLYARARLPVYWIINLVDSRVEVYSNPKGGKAPAYRQRLDYGPGESVPLVLEGQQVGQIHVQEMLP